MQGMIEALRGCLKEELRIDVIANNLANASVPGFKKDRVSFQNLLIQQKPSASGMIEQPADTGMKQVSPESAKDAKPAEDSKKVEQAKPAKKEKGITSPQKATDKQPEK